MLTAVQRAAGNRAATLLAGGVNLHGETTASYDGGRSQVLNPQVRRTEGCAECPADEPCLRYTGTLVVRYNADITIRMPDMPGDLTTCQQRRVRAFLRDVLGPHEQDHARRFRGYNGTTRRAFVLTGCGRAALQEQLQSMHDTQAEQRAAAADARSAAIDPFVREVDLDCD